MLQKPLIWSWRVISRTAWLLLVRDWNLFICLLHYMLHFNMVWHAISSLKTFLWIAADALLRPIHTAQTIANKLVCWSLLDQCVTPVGVGWSLFSPDWTCLISVCWCSVNMTVIFHKILNPTANLFVGVCLCSVNWPLDVPYLLRLELLSYSMTVMLF